MKSSTNMQQKNNQQLDNLLGKVMKEISAEAPSPDFTLLVMREVQDIKISTAYTYQPAITKRGWFFIATIFIGLIILVLMNAGPTKSTWFTQLHFESLYESIPFRFSSLKVSMISLYAVICMTILFFIQLRYLVTRFDKTLGW